MESNTGQVINLGSLYHRFERLTDKRKARGKRYSLAMLMTGMFLAKLCGEDKPSGIAEWVVERGAWMVQVLDLSRPQMPSHHTYRRVLANGIDVNELEELAQEQHSRCGEAGYQVVVSIDGKVLRGTIEVDQHDGLWLLAAYLPGEGITLHKWRSRPSRMRSVRLPPY